MKKVSCFSFSVSISLCSYGVCVKKQRAKETLKGKRHREPQRTRNRQSAEILFSFFQIIEGGGSLMIKTVSGVVFHEGKEETAIGVRLEDGTVINASHVMRS